MDFDFSIQLHFDNIDFIAIGIGGLLIYWAKNHRQKLKNIKNGPQGREKEEKWS